MNADIVPFGKYKSQPVETMLADQGYVEWITGQPGLMTMLQAKYPALFNIITIGAPATDNTPEHNKMQAMFLKQDFQHAFIEAATGINVQDKSRELAQQVTQSACESNQLASSIAEKDVLGSRELVNAATLENAKTEREDSRQMYREEKTKHNKEQKQKYKAEIEKVKQSPWAREVVKPPSDFRTYDEWITKGNGYGSWPQTIKNRKEALEKALNRLKEDESTLQKIVSYPVVPFVPVHPVIEPSFEYGYDLNLSVKWYCEITNVWSQDGYYQSREYQYDSYRLRRWIIGNAHCRCEMRFAIELKPMMGDDFPSVLRQMKRNKSGTLVVGSFNAIGCTLDEVRAIFGGIKIITLDQIRDLMTTKEKLK